MRMKHSFCHTANMQGIMHFVAECVAECVLFPGVLQSMCCCRVCSCGVCCRVCVVVECVAESVVLPCVAECALL